MRLKRTWWLPLGTTLLVSCGYQIPPPEAVQQQASLVAFQDCNNLEKYIQDTAVLDMRAQIETFKQQTFVYYGVEDAAGGTASDAGTPGPSAYTTTNTQVAGVDEADFVKNDGTRIFVLTGHTLYLNQSWPAAQLGTVASLQIEGWPREMFLDEDNHVIVFSSIYSPTEDTLGSGGGPYMGMCAPWACGYGNPVLKTTVVDISTLSQPRVIREVYQPGNYISSRRVGRSVRMVTSAQFRWPQGVRWYPNFSADLYGDKVARNHAFDAIANKNEALIRARKLEDWLPRTAYKKADGTVQQLSYDCSEFSRNSGPTKLGVVSLSTLDLSPETLAADNHPGLARTSLIGEAGQIYASPNALYVASSHWWWSLKPGQDDYTYIHKFDLSDPRGVRYVGSGGVLGIPVDQFSLDEKDGYLRVATTLSKRVDDPSQPWGRLETTNRLSVLGMQNGHLQVVGTSADLAPGERIYSARFMGNRGFVVTYRAVDPLYTFDLKDPTHPTQIGELKVPGFSTYLHPIDENHLLAIGEYVPQDNSFKGRSLKLSLFDVTDFAHPKEAFTQQVGSYSSYSQALWDHKAFNYFPARKLLAIPFWDWQPNGDSGSWNSFVSELRVFGVDPVQGFTSKGAVSMRDVYAYSKNSNWTWYWTPLVRRSVMADDYVYAITDAGIRVSQINALDQPIATVLFPPSVP